MLARSEMEGGRSRESKVLAGIFQQIVTDCRGLTPEVEELATRATKLQHQLSSTATALTSFLDSLQRVAERASSTTGSSHDVGGWLAGVSEGHRGLGTLLKGLASCLGSGLVSPLRTSADRFRRTLGEVDKHHRRTYRKRRNVIKKSTEEEGRLRRKVARKEGLAGCLEAKRVQLEEEERQLEEEERRAVHRASQLERGQYVSIAKSLQPLLEQEAVLGCRHLSSATLGHLLTSLAPLTTERSLPNTSELDSMISQLSDSGPGYTFPTPPPSRSTSRRGSLSSLGSTSSLPRPSLSSLATSPSPLLPRPGLQRSLSQASERPRRVSTASLSSQHSQTLDPRTSTSPDLPSEEFERSVESARPSRSRPSARPATATVQRTSSPWRAPPGGRAGARKPPVWRAERPPVPPRSSSIDRMHRIGRESPDPGEGLRRVGRHVTPDRELRPPGEGGSVVAGPGEGGQGEGGERSSSGSESSGYCGSHDLLARADVHQEPASLPRRPSSSLSSFLPTSAPLRSPSPSRSSPGPPEPPTSHQPCYQDAPLPDPPTFVDTYLGQISAAQAVLRAFPPSSPQSQGVIVPTRLRAKQH